MPVLTPEILERLARAAVDVGLIGLGVVRLDHPGLQKAGEYLDRFLDAGLHGTMQYLERGRAARQDPSRMLPGARSLLVAMAPYEGRSGAIARYAQSRDYHTVLFERLAAVDGALKHELPGTASTICVDTKPIMERAAATLAGLGFLGKHGCVIAPGAGSYVVLGEILCTAQWEGPDAPIDLERALWDACGSCTACLDACPTEAFDGPGELDPRRCISYLTIEYRGPIAEDLAEHIGERIAGCDVCQEVCPYNAGQARLNLPAATWLDPRPGGQPDPDLEHVAMLRSSPYRAFVRHTALNRIPRRELRRNALIALGNRDGALSESERDVLRRASEDPEPLVHQAAKWALERRSRRS